MPRWQRNVRDLVALVCGDLPPGWRRMSGTPPTRPLRTGALKRIVEDAGVPVDRIEVVPNGINLAEFADLPQREARGDRIVLGFVGFVRDWHGLDKVIAAMAEAGDSVPMDLIVLGDGPARAGLERQVAVLGLAERYASPACKRASGFLPSSRDLTSPCSHAWWSMPRL